MLEGKELEGKIGQDANYAVDVTEDGKVIVEIAFEKQFDDAKVKNAASVEVSIFAMAEKIAAKTETKFDDDAVAMLKKILGIK